MVLCESALVLFSFFLTFLVPMLGRTAVAFLGFRSEIVLVSLVVDNPVFLWTPAPVLIGGSCVEC